MRMTYLLNIDQAVDRKYLVTKSLKGQAEAGSIIHVMDAENKGNSVNVSYRVNHFNQKFLDFQDYNVTFKDVAQFCKWAQPDNFIARNYENLDIKDIQHYISVKNRTFTGFCLPIILVIAIILIAVSAFIIPMPYGVIIGSCLTLLAAILVVVAFKGQKKKEKMKLYKKISASWGLYIE